MKINNSKKPAEMNLNRLFFEITELVSTYF